MIAKCANSSCREEFVRFRDGRLYAFELQPRAVGGNGKSNGRTTEWFWLCGECARELTLVTRDQRTVSAVPRLAA